MAIALRVERGFHPTQRTQRKKRSWRNDALLSLR